MAAKASLVIKKLMEYMVFEHFILVNVYAWRLARIRDSGLQSLILVHINNFVQLMNFFKWLVSSGDNLLLLVKCLGEIEWKYAWKKSLFSCCSSLHTARNTYIYKSSILAKEAKTIVRKPVRSIKWPVSVTSGWTLACLASAFTHWSLLMWRSKHLSIRCWTCYVYVRPKQKHSKSESR